MAKRPKCTPCMGSEIKNALRGLEDKALDVALENVPDCPGPREIQLCIIKKGTSRSAYQEFVSQCMRGKKIKDFDEAPQAMRECAAEWRKAKDEGQSRQD